MNKNSPRQDAVSRWARALAERRGYWRAVVAVAAKNARMCWAMLQRGEAFKMPPEQQRLPRLEMTPGSIFRRVKARS